jgi:hypothetical protein
LFYIFVHVSSKLSTLTATHFASSEKLQNTVIECLLLWRTNKGGIVLVVTLHVSVDDINREGIQNCDPELNFDALIA